MDRVPRKPAEPIARGRRRETFRSRTSTDGGRGGGHGRAGDGAVAEENSTVRPLALRAVRIRRARVSCATVSPFSGHAERKTAAATSVEPRKIRIGKTGSDGPGWRGRVTGNSEGTTEKKKNHRRITILRHPRDNGRATSATR